MKRVLITALAVAGLGVAGWQTAQAWQAETEVESENPEAIPVEDPTPAPKPAPTPKASSQLPKGQAAGPKTPKTTAMGSSTEATPMAQRIAQLGLLNKRNGLWRDLTMKPGEAIRIGDVVVRLRACESSPAWADEPLTGAFVQVLTHETDAKWHRTFSGWLYKESPSLNVVEHPVYDVWVKSCQMRHPDMGKDTIVARESDTTSYESEEE